MARTLPWIDLSAYRLSLYAVELPSKKRILMVQGDIAGNQAALVALGFVRTPRGHIIYPEGKLRLKHIQSQLPQAVLREMPLPEIVRLSARSEDRAATPSVTPASASTPTAPGGELPVSAPVPSGLLITRFRMQGL